MKSRTHWFSFFVFSAATILVTSTVSTNSTKASTKTSSNIQSDSDWLKWERTISLARLSANISPSDGAPGSVVASPSRSNPDYYYYWVRDAALIMDTIGKLYQTEPKHEFKPVTRLGKPTSGASFYKDTLYNYAQLARSNQTTATLGGMGEPKFYMDGSAFNGPWGRPQNDGPALRAIALIRFAEILLSEGEDTYVRLKLYDGQIPTQSVIKADLEFVAHHWRESSFDLWEEVKGDHFYTRMVQRKALIRGAALAQRLGDPKAADFYLNEAAKLRNAIESHWDSGRQILVATLNRSAGIDYKTSGLDAAIVLGALHGDAGDGFMTVTDTRVQSTLEKLSESFAHLYSINHRAGVPGIAIGRYPEDRYGGTDFNAGNPWVLTTLALAEAYYEIGNRLQATGQNQTAERAREKADQYIERVRYHAYSDGSLSEQIHRESGFMTSARDLSWNYAAIITALWARDHVR